jgi:predicted dehydrogenase
MANGKVRLGLVSFAHFHQHQWAKVFLEDSRVELVGAWDSNSDRLSQASIKYGIQAFPSLPSLLEKCSAVAVCSETSEHLPIIRLCCEAGISVLCEKPFGPDLKASREIARLIEESKIRYYQSFPQRHIPSNHKIFQMIQTGVLGRITHVRKRHGHGYSLTGLEIQMPWIVDPAIAGGGALLDEGIHEADLLHWFFGEPVSVCADLSFAGAYSVETTGVAVYKFPGDLLCVLEAGWNWVAGGPTTEIYGENGVLIQNNTDCASNAGGGLCSHLNWYDSNAGRWIPLDFSFDFASIHTHAPKDFIDGILEDIPPATSVIEGLNATELIEGAYRSFHSKQTVFFPLDIET